MQKQFQAGLVFLSGASVFYGSGIGSGAPDTCGASVCEALAIQAAWAAAAAPALCSLAGTVARGYDGYSTH